MAELGILIIVPTTASSSRAESLRRAVNSIVTQSPPGVRAAVIVNGNRFDPDLVAWLRSEPGVDYHYLEQGNLPAAIFEGRKRVRTEFFGFLDDDDYLLPGAIAACLDLIGADGGYDVAVTTGFLETAGERKDISFDCETCLANPLGALAERAWLSSCGALFRHETVPPRYFDNVQKYAEWTDIAFRLCLDRRINFGAVRTFVKVWSEGSLSTHPEFASAPQALIRNCLRQEMPAELRRAFRRKFVDELHNASESCLRNARRAAAWGFHLRCLALRGGWKYWAYTRHLFRPAPRS